nr:ABC transporter permease [Streptomyces sp. SID7803]
MLNFIARRIAAGAVLLVVISFLSYLLLSVPHIDVGRQLLGGESAPQSAIDAKNASLGG